MSASILLIDDDDLVRESLKKVLQNRNLSVVTASSGDQAIRLFQENQDFDLVISDVRMPGRNGIETIGGIRNIQKDLKKQCPIMFITGYADDDVPQHAAQLGVSEFILKPFDIEKFIFTVEQLLNSHGQDTDSKLQGHQVEVIRPSSQIGKWKFPHEKFIVEKPILLKETNIMGNTYYDNYITWQGETRERLLMCHPSLEEWMMDNRHIKMITHSTYHRFLTETTFGDLLRIEATTREIKKCSFIMVFRFFNAKTQSILGEGWQRICFSDVRAGKLSPVPQLILDLIEPIREGEAKKTFEANL